MSGNNRAEEDHSDPTEHSSDQRPHDQDEGHLQRPFPSPVLYSWDFYGPRGSQAGASFNSAQANVSPQFSNLFAVTKSLMVPGLL